MSYELYRRPGGAIWYYDFTIPGRPRVRRSSRTEDKTRAHRIAAEAEARAWKGHLDGPGSTLRFSDASIFYRTAGKSTRFLTRVEDHFKDTLVITITGDQIRRAATKAYPTAGPATRNRQFIVPAQAIINHAADAGLCPHLKVKRFVVTTRIKTPATVEWVTAFAANASPHLGALCLFMFGTGARIGEAVALTWADVDMSERTALIRQTKIGDERIANIQPLVLAAMANIASNRNPDDPVFKYAHRENVRKVWDNAITRAKIRKLSPHSCRHGFATTMLHKRVDVKTVAKMGGWKDVATLVRTYAHAMGDRTVTNVIFDTNPAQPETNVTVTG